MDSLNEDNAADFSINNTGDAAWKIQLKQNNVELEKGQWYRLSLDAKASIPRKLMFAIQRDGTSDDDWTPYSGEKIVDLGTDYNTYEIVFQMTGETDPKAVLSISMGAVDGIQITEKHRICIDNINLEKIDAPDIGEQPVGENLLANSDFASEVKDGKMRLPLRERQRFLLRTAVQYIILRMWEPKTERTAQTERNRSGTGRSL